MTAHSTRLEFCEDPARDRMGRDIAWRATAINRDDVEVAEAWGRDPLAAVSSLVCVLADESAERAAYLPDDYVELAYRQAGETGGSS